MAARAHHTADVPCPDPSVHEKHDRLSEQASTAALLATQPGRSASTKAPATQDLLDQDGKLSSKSAATSLKHARPQDLPGFPTVGISNTADSAGKAALLAKDYKMKELWQHETSSAGSKAAMLAHRDSKKLDLWQASPSKDGNSAASMAMKNKSLSPQLDQGYTADGKQRALLAASLSVRRDRSGSSPPAVHPAYPDSKNSAKNALNAATASHRAGTIKNKPSTDGWDSEANQAARIQNLDSRIDGKMFGEHPPLKMNVEEEKHNAALRASAVSMAKQMYDYENRTSTPTSTGTNIAGAGAETAAAQQAPSAQSDLKSEALRYIHLQDAAHKLAQERLAKVDKELEGNKYKEYYGYPNEQNPTSPRKSLSRRFSRRQRASSEADSLQDSDDEEQARRIRSQTSQLQSSVSNVDQKKRADDRAKLLAAAEKRVNSQMHDMDEKVFSDTGRIPPTMMDEWEAKARLRAQEEKEVQNKNVGKTHIGGGKFMDQAEIEAIAAARLKPTLDEISENAQKRRDRDEEIRLQQEEAERQRQAEKQRLANDKLEQRKIKDEEKAVARKEKAEEKARIAEEKRLAKEEKARVAAIAREEKRKSREPKRQEIVVAGSGAAAGTAAAEDTAAETKGESADKSALEEGAVGVGGAAAVAEAVHHHDEGTQPTSIEQPIGETTRDAADSESEVSSLDWADEDDSDAEVSNPLRPELERHISALPHSESDTDDEGRQDDSDPYVDNAPLGQSHARNIAERVGLAPETSHEEIEQPSQVTSTTAATVESKGDATGPAPKTAGPHESDIANILDPRVKPDANTLQGKPSDTQPSATATKSTATDTTAAPVGPGIADGNITHPEEDDEHKSGFRGLMKRLRGARKRTQQRVPKAEEYREKAAAAPSSSTAPTAAAVGTAAVPAASDAKPSTDDEEDSDDMLSSSDAEDHDTNARGRSTGDADEAGETIEQTTTRDDDGDHFEEARDTFDESLAPPPSFAGQLKSQSPVRGTKFREEV